MVQHESAAAGARSRMQYWVILDDWSTVWWAMMADSVEDVVYE